MELGFVPGERIEVIEEQRPGGDPIAVRVGCSMFALRRREAQAVMVRVDGEGQ
jgi:ferrous iron transport protein A